MTGWSARALARMVDVPTQTVMSWVTAGLITPEQFGKGRGGHVIGVSGLMELLAVIELRQAGFSLQAIKRTVDNLREISGSERPLARLTLVISGQDIAWRDSEELADMPISALQQPGQRLMLLPVGQMHTDLLRNINSEASLV